MNAMTTVMNNPDLLRTVFAFAYAPMTTCCSVCKKGKTPAELHLTKKVVEIERGTDYKIEQEYYCECCWRRHFIFYSYGDSHSNRVQNIGLLKYRLKMSGANLKKINAITDEDFLFKKHRMRKTQEKINIYKKIIYDFVKNYFNKTLQEAKDKKNYKTFTLCECLYCYGYVPNTTITDDEGIMCEWCYLEMPRPKEQGKPGYLYSAVGIKRAVIDQYGRYSKFY